jgi:hypothetical protein
MREMTEFPTVTIAGSRDAVIADDNMRFGFSTAIVASSGWLLANLRCAIALPFLAPLTFIRTISRFAFDFALQLKTVAHPDSA